MTTFFIVVFTLFCRVAFPVEHSLKFMFTGSSGASTSFVGVVKVDETEMVYCDSSVSEAQPKHDWQKIFMDKTSELKNLYAHCLGRQIFFTENIRDLMKHPSQSGGVHTFQWMYGCEQDDETGGVKSFDQFGYDGKDFVAFDQKVETWTNVNQRNLDNEKIRIRSFRTKECFEWLKKYLDYGRSFLQRTDLPSVSLLQKTPSSPVICLATGFYPDRADLVWTKDGEKLHEDKNSRPSLPNHDGTFQLNVVLKLSSIKPEDWRRYDCVFQLAGVKYSIITKLDKQEIKTNRDYYICKIPDETNTHINVAVLVFSLFLFADLIFIAYKVLKVSGTSSGDPSSPPDEGTAMRQSEHTDGSRGQQPDNHLKCAFFAAVVVAVILIVLHGVLISKNYKDLHISVPSDYVSKWTEPLPGKIWSL